MGRTVMMMASVLGAIGVMLGAFGAHAFEETLEAAGRLDTFETAVKYHFYHTLAALVAPVLLKNPQFIKQAKVASWLFISGILLFSGSLYFLCFTGVTSLAIITPFGGVAFIVGWLWLSYAIYRHKFDGTEK